MFIPLSKFLPYYLIFLFLGTFERVISTFIHKKVKTTKHVFKKWTFFILLYSYLFIIGCSIIECLLIVKIVNLNITSIGVIIFIAGILLRRKSIAGLGDNWSVYIEIKENHKLITNGIYRYLKHPYCLAVFLELVGICLIGNAFYSLTLVFFIQVPLLIVRIILEEKVLISYFGDVYLKYKSTKLL